MGKLAYDVRPIPYTIICISIPLLMRMTTMIMMTLVLILFLFYVSTAETLDVGEYLEISGIMRTQAGRYECKANNDVATPDVKYVNVVVNCKYLSPKMKKDNFLSW